MMQNETFALYGAFQWKEKDLTNEDLLNYKAAWHIFAEIVEDLNNVTDKILAKSISNVLLECIFK